MTSNSDPTESNSPRNDIGQSEHDNQTVGQTVRFDPNGDPENPTPTADDPYDASVPGEEILTRREEKIVEEQHADETGERGPAYEHADGILGDNPGGSSDPNNTVTAAEMPTERIPEQP